MSPTSYRTAPPRDAKRYYIISGINVNRFLLLLTGGSGDKSLEFIDDPGRKSSQFSFPGYGCVYGVSFGQ